ncbi:MAG TPA: vanadium-dependent haloperoxidase [Longimicrobiales bacterium]
MRFRSASLIVAATLVGCSEQSVAPADIDAEFIVVAPRAVNFWNELAAVQWNERATSLAAAQVVDVGRMYAYLSFAQHRAASAAAAGNDPHPPISSAIGAASATVLAAFFPTRLARIEAALDTQRAAARWPGAKHADFAAGETLGRAIGAQVMAWAQTDGIGLTDPGTPPIGPGKWIWTGGPIARGNLGARAFFLDAPDEFRPVPPPAFGSLEFLSALAEVRDISINRTDEQKAIALFWHLNQSPRSNSVMNGKARELIVKYHRDDTEAARILFLANASAFDALIGCFDAKYHYWYLRPTMADPTITIAPGVSLPPHPSYPSAHSCISGAITTTLIAAFPSERSVLEALAFEAGMSRVFAGIHYRFDSLAGLELGAGVARKAWRSDLGAIDITP